MLDKINDHLRAAEAVRNDVQLFQQIADEILQCFQRGGRLYLMGNGGSAADAQHIAAEFIGRFKKHRRALPAIALTTDSSTLTAVSNDMSFETVFERQVDALVSPGDIVWALSVSGTSPNIVRALRNARMKKARTIGFTGKAPNDFEALCDFCFRAAHRSSDRVQEMHQLAYHLICEVVEAHFAGEPA